MIVKIVLEWDDSLLYVQVDCSQNYLLKVTFEHCRVCVCVCRTKLDFKKLVTKMCKNDNDVITDVINYI